MIDDFAHEANGCAFDQVIVVGFLTQQLAHGYREIVVNAIASEHISNVPGGRLPTHYTVTPLYD